MTTVQIRNIATGFINVLRNHDDAYQQWRAVAATHNYAALGAFVQQTMHLATTPTQADLDAMDEYIGRNLPGDAGAFEAARPGTPAAMSICGLQEENES